MVLVDLAELGMFFLGLHLNRNLFFFVKLFTRIRHLMLSCLDFPQTLTFSCIICSTCSEPDNVALLKTCGKNSRNSLKEKARPGGPPLWLLNTLMVC